MNRRFRDCLSLTGVGFAMLLHTGCDQKAPIAPAQETAQVVEQTAPVIEAEHPNTEPHLQVVTTERPDAPPIPPPSDLEPVEPTGAVLFYGDFDNALIGERTALNFHTHPGFKADYIELGSETEPNRALILAGSDEPRHSWRPALEFRYTPQTGGRMKISFDVYQASYEAASLNLQVIDMRSGYRVYQSMRMTNEFVNEGPGNRNRYFTDLVTAGAEARWHRFEWVFPIPGGPDSEMALRFDGKTEGNIRHKHSTSGGLDGLRMFLPLRRNADVIYYIDNVMIENLNASDHGSSTNHNAASGLQLLSN